MNEIPKPASPLWAFRDYGTSAPFVCFGERVYFMGNGCWQSDDAEHFRKNPERFQPVETHELQGLVVSSVESIVNFYHAREDFQSAALAKARARIEQLEAALRECLEMMEDRYDGAEDSVTLWMGGPIAAARKALQ